MKIIEICIVLLVAGILFQGCVSVPQEKNVVQYQSVPVSDKAEIRNETVSKEETIGNVVGFNVAIDSDGIGMFYQHTFTDSFAGFIEFYYITDDYKELTLRSKQIDIASKWYWNNNAPFGGYVYVDIGLANSFVLDEFVDKKKELSLLGCGSGLGISTMSKNRFIDFVVDVQLGVSIVLWNNNDLLFDEYENRIVEKVSPTFAFYFGIPF